MIRLFRVFVPTSVLALLAFDALLITSAFILTTYLVMEVDPVPYLYDGGLVRIFVMVLTVLTNLSIETTIRQRQKTERKRTHLEPDHHIETGEIYILSYKHVKMFLVRC